MGSNILGSIFCFFIGLGLFIAYKVLMKKGRLDTGVAMILFFLLGITGLLLLIMLSSWGSNFFADTDSGVGAGIGFFLAATIISVLTAIAPSKEQKIFRIVSCALFFVFALCLLGSCFYMGRLMLGNEIVR